MRQADRLGNTRDLRSGMSLDAEWLLNRRDFLIASAGGLASLLPLRGLAQSFEQDPWLTIDAVQSHLFPSEPDAPGAAEINALDYLRFVVGDDTIPLADRDFILQGARWLEEQSLDWEGSNFFFLNEKLKERTLLRVASSQAGENWISTLLLYLFEALLTDPVYGGNPDRIGWRWLGHTPGFPRPGPDKRFDRLT